MPRSSSNGSAATCRRMRSPRSVTRCSAAATATGPRPTSRFRGCIDEQLAAHGARSVYVRGEGDARSDLDGQFESWFAKLAPLATKEFGVDSNFSRSADDEPLYKIEPVAPTAINASRCPRRRRADEGAGQHRTAKQERRQRLGPVDPAHRGAIAFRHQLPSRRSPQRGAAQRSGAGRFGGAPLRVPAGRPDPVAGRRRPPRAIAGRRYGVGRDGC